MLDWSRLSISFTVIGFPVELELEAVERGGLRGLGGDAVGDELGIGHRPLGGVEQHVLELAHGELVQFGAVSEQVLGFVDDRGIAVERGVGLAGGLGGGVVRRR